MNGVIIALIIALSFILSFFWAPIVGVFFDGSLDLAQPLRFPDNSVNTGYVTGYADNEVKIGETAISNPIPDQGKMGIITFRISLNSYQAFFRNDISVDLNAIMVTFVTSSGSETLVQKSSRPMTKPGWTISRRTGIMPFQKADQDNVLEPYESYEILIYPSIPLAPMSRFLILIQLPDRNQIFLPRTVPASISQVMNLN